MSNDIKQHQTTSIMLMTFLSSVFITLFLVLGALSLHFYLEYARERYPFTWTCYQHVIVLAIIAALCFIAACLFGTQIPACYATL